MVALFGSGPMVDF